MIVWPPAAAHTNCAALMQRCRRPSFLLGLDGIIRQGRVPSRRPAADMSTLLRSGRFGIIDSVRPSTAPSVSQPAVRRALFYVSADTLHQAPVVAAACVSARPMHHDAPCQLK